MYSFGKHSKKQLDTLHEDLKDVLNAAIKYVDFTIVEGLRDEKSQMMYFSQGKTKVQYPYSKHNKTPSLAVDIVPWVKGIGTDWNNRERFKNIVFFIKGIAFSKGIELRLGIDWDSDFYSLDHSFIDLPHIELKSKLIDGTWVGY